jgi:hypothetical protein
MNKAVFLLSFILLVCSSTAWGEQSETFGNYTVHYNAFTTDNLTPDVAGHYNITRSKSRVLLNITVLKNDETDSLLGTPVKAKITGNVKNLSEQLRELEFREIMENDATYYIAVTPISHEEVLIFTLNITPEGTEKTHQLSFQQKFFSN